MNYCKYTIAIALLVVQLIPFQAYSQEVVTPLDQNTIEMQQRQLIEQQQRRIEELKKLPGPIVEDEEGALPTDGRCFEVKEIEITGVSLFKPAEIIAITQPFINTCVGMPQINSLLRKLTNLYVAKGYITSRAYVPQQNLSEGKLVIIVVEGKISAIEPAPDANISECEIAFAMPGITGDVLNLRDLEQGIDQINRLPSNNAKLQLLPGEEAGASIVQVVNQKSAPWRVSLSKHNHGNDSTGKQQWSSQFDWDNPLNINDQVRLLAGKDAVSDSLRESRFGYLEYNVPYGKWTSTYSFSYNDYETFSESNDFIFLNSGDNRTHKLAVERLVFRDQVSKVHLKSSVSHIRTRNFIEEILLDINSHQLTEFQLGLNYGRIVLGGYLNTELNFHRGTRWLGAQNDKTNDSATPKAQYEMVSATVSAVKPFQLAGQDLSYTALISGQWSDDVLHSPVRISVGGQSSVRGFDEQSLSGDSGYYWRNELAWQVPNVKSLSSNILTGASVILAYDVGVIHHGRFNDGQSGRIAGVALGVRLHGEHINMELFTSKTLSKPNHF
ncbi:ShlB/FhaC/HecB family hemolysin secretion/activation protein, partial [Spartinivicinus poritis]